MKIESNYEINKIYQDDFGRVSGIFAVDKSEGQMSHDVVYEYRRKFNTKKVGHAGTLDPFASGLLIILVGKATKLSDRFLSLDKEYIAEIALGIQTDTLDPEGTIVKLEIRNQKLEEKRMKGVLRSFQPEYDQHVPVFSSVKVQGNKLRELARKGDSYKIVEKDGVKYIQFLKNNEVWKELPLPVKKVQIYEIELINIEIRNLKSEKKLTKLLSSLTEEQLNSSLIEQIPCLTIKVRCSKGTYIRKLAEDIGEKLRVPAMLIGLRRTKVGNIQLLD